MWWLPIGTALFLVTSIAILHLYQGRRDTKNTQSYRYQYLQIVSQLELITDTVAVLQQKVHLMQDEKSLSYFESSLKILEILLKTMRKVQPFGSSPAILASVQFLIRDFIKRIHRLELAFEHSLNGQEVNHDKLYQLKNTLMGRGCYFCSRPTIKDRFSRVRVKLDGKNKSVLSCNVCKEELKSSKKVKVLHLVKDGKTVHWSELEDYTPSEHYWDINNKHRKSNKSIKKLELVVSNIETTSKPEQPRLPPPKKPRTLETSKASLKLVNKKQTDRRRKTDEEATKHRHPGSTPPKQGKPPESEGP